MSASDSPTASPPDHTLGAVAVSGSHGLIGSTLTAALENEGRPVRRLVRTRPRPDSPDVYWKPSAGEMEARQLSGVDAVVHLAGESVAERWTEEKKRRIHESRVRGTRLLAEGIASLERPPRVLVSASAIGFYGDRGDEKLSEESPPGNDFLAGVAREWEAATAPAAEAGVRIVNLRFGVVLSREGGALKKMLPPFRLGIGGKLGSGRQWMSWISLEDTVDAIRFALRTEGLSGPVNVVAPNPVTNAEFTETFGRVLGRPTLFTVPGAALRLLFGEMADAALLASQRASPDRLQSAGFTFRHPALEGALRTALE